MWWIVAGLVLLTVGGVLLVGAVALLVMGVVLVSGGLFLARPSSAAPAKGDV
jgi:hypothetical protein